MEKVNTHHGDSRGRTVLGGHHQAVSWLGKCAKILVGVAGEGLMHTRRQEAFESKTVQEARGFTFMETFQVVHQIQWFLVS